MKLVVAHMEKEPRAEENGYPTHICVSKEATDLNYDNTAVQYMTI
jgi:proline dehydrogenase